METRSQRVTREDFLLFVNACFACTGQKEFYGDGYGQTVSLRFLHQYILGNYRSLYARVLACGVNHMNQALIVENLLASGRETDPGSRAEENALITRSLDGLPTHRAMHLLSDVAGRGVNNRRTRALTKRYLGATEKRDFRAVKYRRTFRRAAMHAHMRYEGELAAFFVKGWRERRFQTPLFESFRQAHYAESAIYDLPYSIAEGLAQKHGVRRDIFLERIAPKMTENERMRLRDTGSAHGVALDVNWARQPPTRVASYVLSLPQDERVARMSALSAALDQSTGRAIRRTAARFGKVACVLDRSFSSSGSNEKRKRPLAVALAVSRFLSGCAASCAVFWTGEKAGEPESELLVTPRGSTDLVTPVLHALRTAPELLVIVSDGFDNDPEGLLGQVLEAGQRLLPGTFVIHLNPVYDNESYAPKSFSPKIATMGVRDADEIPTLVAFARFARGGAPLAELAAHLDARVAAFLAVSE